MKARSPYVLVVSPSVQRSSDWVEALAEQGFSAFACASAREALCAPRPEILVTELALPDHDGLELCEALQAGSREIATILVCDQGSLELYRRAMNLGVHDLLPADAPASDLVPLVQSASESMNADSGCLEFAATIPSTATACEQVQRELAAWLLVRGIAPSTRCRIATALGESLENACRHAYPDDIGAIDIQAVLDGTQLNVHVFDRGEGLDEILVRRREALGEAGGLARMRSLSEELTVHSHPTLGTHLRLSFSVHRTQFSEEACTDFEDFDFLVPDHVRALLTGIQRPGETEVVHLSPAVAVTVGRLLAGPDPSHLFASGF
ncbi:MAG: ATP-binding protein [Planctomycetes bacterium]|nr:ATP-binding protein [Planctomycetota bacterium]MCB9909969.1 ATP-binding protein [Planctomycetota bacterium]HRV80203.1 ATP-binding protein [Planctomycetota bacterium]